MQYNPGDIVVTRNGGLNKSFLFSGHIGITVDDTYKACERFERLGVEFVKKPDDGNLAELHF